MARWTVFGMFAATLVAIAIMVVLGYDSRDIEVISGFALAAIVALGSRPPGED